MSKWGKLVSLGSSYPAVERGWLQSYDLKTTKKKKKRYPTYLATQWGRGYNRESGKWDLGVT